MLLSAILAVCAGGAVHAGTIAVAWNPNSDPDLAGYRVYRGSVPGVYDGYVDVGLATSTTLTGVGDCSTWYVAVKAYDTGGLESATFSNEVSGWARPEVTAAIPASGERGARMSVVVNGTNFMDGATVGFANPSIAVLGVTRNACGELVADVQIAADAALGTTNVDVDNPDGVFGTGIGLFTVVDATVPATIDSHPSNATVPEGSTATFTVSASGTAPLAYQWQRNGTDIAGANAPTYVTPPTTMADNGATFRCVVSNAAGTDTSNPATLTVTDATAPTVQGATPADGAVDVDPAVHPTVTFSEAIDPASVTAATVQLLDATGAVVPQAAGAPQLSADGRTATVVPAQPLAESATYRVRVVGGPSGVRDVAGNPLASDWQQTTGFTTRDPVNQSPAVVENVHRTDARPPAGSLAP